MTNLMQEFYRIESLTNDRCKMIMETREKLSVVYEIMNNVATLWLSIIETAEEEIASIENLIDSIKCNDDVDYNMLKDLEQRLMGTINIKRYIEDYMKDVIGDK
jgi:hypothetical protein